jgi:predicted GIY-YIG superfamily endonuclease
MDLGSIHLAMKRVEALMLSNSHRDIGSAIQNAKLASFKDMFKPFKSFQGMPGAPDKPTVVDVFANVNKLEEYWRTKEQPYHPYTRWDYMLLLMESIAIVPEIRVALGDAVNDRLDTVCEFAKSALADFQEKGTYMITHAKREGRATAHAMIMSEYLPRAVGMDDGGNDDDIDDDEEYFIYVICSPLDPTNFYIGRTANPTKRWSAHYGMPNSEDMAKWFARVGKTAQMWIVDSASDLETAKYLEGLWTIRLNPSLNTSSVNDWVASIDRDFVLTVDPSKFRKFRCMQLGSGWRPKTPSDATCEPCEVLLQYITDCKPVGVVVASQPVVAPDADGCSRMCAEDIVNWCSANVKHAEKYKAFNHIKEYYAVTPSESKKTSIVDMLLDAMLPNTLETKYWATFKGEMELKRGKPFSAFTIHNYAIHIRDVMRDHPRFKEELGQEFSRTLAAWDDIRAEASRRKHKVKKEERGKGKAVSEPSAPELGGVQGPTASTSGTASSEPTVSTPVPPEPTDASNVTTTTDPNAFGNATREQLARLLTASLERQNGLTASLADLQRRYDELFGIVQAIGK